MYKICLLALVLSSIQCLQGRYPIAVLHGINDFCFDFSNIEVAKVLGAELNVYSKCIEVGNGAYTSVFSSMELQGQKACSSINSNKNFHGDFAIVGLSQGNLIARYVIQKCNTIGKVKKYLSLGGPQMGVYRLPLCIKGQFCKKLADTISHAIQNPFIQQHVAPAQYWRDPNNPQDFLNVSLYLADINNEKSQKNEQYKQRILELEKMILVRFLNDQVVYPSISQLFGYITGGETPVEIKITDTDIYKGDYLGLKSLNERNALKFIELPGKHLQWNKQQLQQLAKELE